MDQNAESMNFYIQRLTIYHDKCIAPNIWGVIYKPYSTMNQLLLFEIFYRYAQITWHMSLTFS